MDDRQHQARTSREATYASAINDAMSGNEQATSLLDSLACETLRALHAELRSDGSQAQAQWVLRYVEARETSGQFEASESALVKFLIGLTRKA